MQVTILEAAKVLGGHARVETICGVVYEPEGAHIFHTSDPEVAALVQRLGMSRPYRHQVLASVIVGGQPFMLSWPPQVGELEQLPVWPQVKSELAELPPAPSGDDLETYVIGSMGPTLYGILVRDYTIKQWGRHPRDLSSIFAPKRVELRSDGNRQLFRDRWEYFEPHGANAVIEALVAEADIVCGQAVDLETLRALHRESDAIVITSPLDDLVGSSKKLEWRGIRMESHYMPLDDPGATVTAGYVINYPGPEVPYTRTIESKHATGQQVRGTVVSYEFPGSAAKHYPVPTVDHSNERLNEDLKEAVRRAMYGMPVYFAGRLANYMYINQDQAIRQGIDVARQILGDTPPRDPSGAVAARQR